MDGWMDVMDVMDGCMDDTWIRNTFFIDGM
jgi:hypothetical protein